MRCETSVEDLTQEAISDDPGSHNGTLGYSFDPVGNRLTLNWTLGGISFTAQTYDADDRLTVDTCDANGNMLTSGGKTYAYDFANRLTSVNPGAIAMVYDGDGNRVSKGSTQYLVSEVNPTGLPQVVEELVAGAVQRNYAYGLQRIAEDRVVAGAIVPSFYSYDGHGDVRLLTDATGTVTDTYDYDSYGNVVSSTGSTPNVYLYQGEQFDSETGFYYLRARYYSPATGRFLSEDPAISPIDDPGSAHPYLYAGANPVDQMDPTGQFFESAIALQVVTRVAANLIPSASISNNFTSGTFTFVGRQFICIMSEVGSVLRNAVGLYNYGDCTSNVFSKPPAPPGGPGGPGPGGPGGSGPGTCGANGYRDATSAESQTVLDKAKTYLGWGYMDVGQCTGLVAKAIRGTVNPGFPQNGPVGTIAQNAGLRPFTSGDSPRAGDVMVWGSAHMGFLDPNPPAGLSPPGQTVFSARGRPPQQRPGVTWGQPRWFTPQGPLSYRRVRIPCRQ